MLIRRRRLQLALGLSLIVLTACATEEPPFMGPTWNDGMTWVLDAESIAILAPGAPATASVTITLEKGEVGGTAACNTYGGTYRAGGVSGDDLTIEVGQMTEMACEEPLMELETSFIEALGQVSSYREVDEGLILTGGVTALTFMAEPSVEALPLTGPMWELTTIALPGSDVVGSVIADTEITAVFADDGTMTGSGGCNQLNGPYETDDGALTIGPLASTMMSCGADIDEQEQAYLATIDAVFSFTIEGSQLTMQDVDGADMLVFGGS